MTDTQSTTDELVRPLMTPEGGFTMLALDQRESLRRMFPLANGVEVDDETLRAFKLDAIRALTPHASGVLLDRPYAVTTERPAGIADGCGLILAADVLHQPAGRGVQTSSLDEAVTADFIRAVGAVAIKFLVMWRPDGRASERLDLIDSFVALAGEAGVASLVEAIAKPADGDDWDSAERRHEAILSAAEELGGRGSIYKAEVPGYAPGDVSAVREHAEELTRLVPVPWVVLSNGTAPEDFADAVREACYGGASGFLAGRAIWADTVVETDPVSAMEQRSIARLQELASIVAASRAS